MPFFYILIGFVFIPFESHWGKQFEFVSKASSLGWSKHIYPLLSSLQKGKQINLKRLFQKNCILIPFPISFLTCLLTLMRHTRGSMWGLVWELGLFAHFVIPCFHLLSNGFSSMLRKRLSLPHPLAFVAFVPSR
jgi:hypothetical protein